jgi:ketosteroid isomerase-like protein
MKRDNIEFLIGWLDALRRDDRDALRAALDANAVWQGLRDEWVCRNADEIVEEFAAGRDRYQEIGALELIGAERHAILHAYGGDVQAVEDMPLPDGIYNLFAIEDGRISRIDDFADRRSAVAAARL